MGKIHDFDTWVEHAAEHEKDHLVAFYHALNLHHSLTEITTPDSGIVSNLSLVTPMPEQFILAGTKYFLITPSSNPDGFTLSQNGIPISVQAGVTTPVMIPAVSSKGQWMITDTTGGITYQVLAFRDIPAPQGVVSVQTVGVGASTGKPSYTTLVSSTITSELATSAVYTLASTTETVSGVSANLPVGIYRELTVDVDVTALAGTSPTITPYVQRLGADGVWYPLWTGTTLSATGTVSTSIGAGLATNQSFGGTVRFGYTIAGTTPSITLSASMQGK